MTNQAVRLSLCAFVGLLFACTTGRGTDVGGTTVKPAAPALPTTVNLGPGDVFEVHVFGEEDLSGTYRVADDGSIDFPLVGKVEVRFLTASSLADKLTSELRAYLKSPNVSIFVKELNSKKVYVFGFVKQPGTFVYEPGMNVVQAITLAGGFEQLADQNETSVTRLVEGKEVRSRVPVKAIGQGEVANFPLLPGDIVFVPERMF